jgi:hypothetical protein
VREWERTRPALPAAAFVDRVLVDEGVRQIGHIPQKLQEIKKRSVVALLIAPGTLLAADKLPREIPLAGKKRFVLKWIKYENGVLVSLRRSEHAHWKRSVFGTVKEVVYQFVMEAPS